jgi:hypothetical protein
MHLRSTRFNFFVQLAVKKYSYPLSKHGVIKSIAYLGEIDSIYQTNSRLMGESCPARYMYPFSVWICKVGRENNVKI